MKRQLEEALREGGEKITQGRIRIDTTRALQRLRDFRFADPSHWVLEILRAAAEGQATTVEVTTDADDVTLDFDGRTFSPAVMDDLLTRALEPGETEDEARARLLALGVAGALGAGAVWVKVESGKKVVLLTQGAVEVTIRDSTLKGARVQLHKAFGWRVIAGYFRGAPEVDAVKNHALRFPARVLLNGDERDAFKAPRGRVEELGFTLDLDVDLEKPRAHSELAFEVSGVWVSTRRVQLPGLPLNAWLASRELKRNASGSDVVNDDPSFERARKLMAQRSLELLESELETLAKDPTWRSWFLDRLGDDGLDSRARKQLNAAKLFPDPGGEFVSLDAIAESLRRQGRIFVAKQAWARGSFPEPTVLLDEHDPRIAKLLPEGKHLDVERQVRARQAVIEARERFLSTPTVEATLRERDWLLRAPIKGSGFTGEVGLAPTTRGAFVQVLAQGRPFVSNELVGLAPLRLRAIVNYERDLADSFFEEGGDVRLLGLVKGRVEEAAIGAICAAASTPEAEPLVLDLLRHLAQRNTRIENVPPELRAAKLFPTLDRQRRSFDEFGSWDRWPWVSGWREAGLLNGAPVLVLDDSLLEIVKKIGGAKRLDDVTEQLDAEFSIRKRMAGPPDQPVLRAQMIARVPLIGDGLHGEVGLPLAVGSSRLELTALRNGLRLETTQLSARFHGVEAIVESSAFTPNQKWSGFKRDEAWQSALSAVQDAERRLAVALVSTPRNHWSAQADAFLFAFFERDLGRTAPARFDEVQRAVYEAPLFDAGSIRASLKDLQAASRLFTLPVHRREQVPDELLVVFEAAPFLTAIEKVLGRRFEDAGPELERAAARRQLDRLPALPLALVPPREPEVRRETPTWSAVCGLRDEVTPEAHVDLRVRGRAWARLTRPSSLPLDVVLEVPDLELTDTRALVAKDLATLEEALTDLRTLFIEKALDGDDAKPLLLAIGRSLDSSLNKAQAAALRARRLFPCTDGKTRSLDELGLTTVQFVSTRLEGQLPDERPIVIADTPALRAALSRFKSRDDVENALRTQLAGVAQHAGTQQVETITCTVAAPFRQRFDRDGFKGEVVFPPSTGGRLEVFLDRRPLVVREGAISSSISAAVDSTRFSATIGMKDVKTDAVWDEALQIVLSEARTLADQIATKDLAAPWDTILARFGLELAARQSWTRGKASKGKRKKKSVEPTASSPLFKAAILRGADDSPFSLQGLFELQEQVGRVPFVTRGGTFMTSRRAWWPRVGELEAARALGFIFEDVTSELDAADRRRALPRYTTIESPLVSDWCEPVDGPGLTGEVALAPQPSGRLVIEILFGRSLLGRWSEEHPLGGVARVDSTRITPDDTFTDAKRDAHFKQLVSATETALALAAQRRLEAGEQDLTWLTALLRWRSEHPGGLGLALGRAPLFATLDGRTLSRDAVVALAASRGKVPVAEASLASLAPAGETILVENDRTLALLAAIRVSHDSIGEELQRRTQLQQQLTQRRLNSLQWSGPSLVRRPLTGRLKGELALSNARGELRLARDGIAVQRFDHRWPGVVGVVEIPNLQVNAEWTSATLTRAQQEWIADEVDALFGQLAEQFPSLDKAERDLARDFALRHLANELEGKFNLERLDEGALSVARAPLFQTTDGLRVSLEEVNSTARAWGRVALFEAGLLVPHREGVLSLVCESFDRPWVGALEALIGKSRVWKVTDRGAWEAEVREADPPTETPLARGLALLRKEMRLLRAGALGSLTPNELDDVRLSRGEDAGPMRYDAARKLMLLDPEHELIQRSLTELGTRPERLWVLLAAIFGHVNRALDRVTDEHEAALALTLAGHLAQNPKLLEPQNDAKARPVS